MDFARYAQNQTRMAALYTRVDAWAAAAAGLVSTVVTNLDADLDGEAEYWLYNRHVAAVFERIGGRMIAAWLRTSDGRVRQMVGNLASYAGSETEEEGADQRQHEQRDRRRLPHLGAEGLVGGHLRTTSTTSIPRRPTA